MKNLLLSRPFKVLVLISILLFGGSCAKNKVHSTSKENPDDQSLEPVMKRVEFQGDLKDVLIVAGVKQSKVNEDLLKAEVRLQNLKDKEINLLSDALKKTSPRHKWLYFAGGILIGTAASYGVYRAIDER